MISGELPLEGMSQPLVMAFELVQAQGEIRKGLKVIGRKDFTLEDGEMEFDLI